MSNPKIVVYSGRFCGYCTAAERLLQSKNAEYELIKVDEDPAMFDHMMEITGRRVRYRSIHSRTLATLAIRFDGALDAIPW